MTTRKMMGEYCVYYQGKLIGDICDNCLFLKPTESVLRLMPDADRAYPYEGSRIWMVAVDDVENGELMAEVLSAMYQELQEPKKKAKKIKKNPAPQDPFFIIMPYFKIHFRGTSECRQSPALSLRLWGYNLSSRRYCIFHKPPCRNSLYR